MSRSADKDVVLGAFTGAVLGFDLGGRVARALPRRPPARARVRVVAVGKAAPAMLRAAFSAWSSRIERAVIALPDGTPFELEGDRIDVFRAGHPLPDARSVDAASRILELAEQGPSDLLLVLVSGGASALLAAPIEGVTLEDKVGVTRALLASGAPIEAINVVRRHLSRIKGGGLSRAAAPGRVLALLASDVIGGGMHDIGSGPTVVDPTTVEDARAALARWAPSHRGLPLAPTLGPDEPAARRQRAKVVASPDDLAAEVARRLSEVGLAVRALPASTESARDIAAFYERSFAELAPGCAWVRAAEPSVEVDVAGSGKGGRAGHVAALVGRRLPAGLLFLAGASDGVDGTSGAAGALVDDSFRELGDQRIDSAIGAFDTASLHEAAGTAIRMGPTGKNFADVHVLCRLR